MLLLASTSPAYIAATTTCLCLPQLVQHTLQLRVHLPIMEVIFTAIHARLHVLEQCVLMLKAVPNAARSNLHDADMVSKLQ